MAANRFLKRNNLKISIISHAIYVENGFVLNVYSHINISPANSGKSNL